MTLVLERHTVHQLTLAASIGLRDGTLTVDGEVLTRTLTDAVPELCDVRLAVAHPGDATRVLCVKDVVQPRCKPAGDPPGKGLTRIIDGVGVVTCGPIVGFQEGIIDLSGPGAAYSPFSELALLIVDADVAPGTEPHAHEAALRRAGLLVAEHVAELVGEHDAQCTERYEWTESPAAGDLPRLGYVYMVLSQGLLHDTYVLGENAASGLPRLLDPLVVIDGGIVSGNCVSACDKNTTWHHQNNPIVLALLEGHGHQWQLAGVIVTNAATRLAQKQAAAEGSVALARQLSIQGAIVSKEGFGNPDADLMLLLGGLERSGIRCVGLTDEFAGPDGASQSLADVTPEADALVSTGNANERIVLPAVAQVIGPLPDVTRLAGGYPHSLRDDGTLEVELQAIMGATNELGASRLGCVEV